MGAATESKPRVGLPAPFQASNHRSVQLESARQLERNGKLEEALAAYQELTEEPEQAGAAWHRLAIVHERLGDNKQAIKCYQEALDTDNPDPQVVCDLGYSWYLQGNLDKAEKVLQFALDLSQDFPRAHNNLGLVYARQGKPEDAENEFLLAGCTMDEARQNLELATQGYAEPKRRSVDARGRDE